MSAPPAAYDGLAAALRSAAQAMAPGEDIQIWTKCDGCGRRLRARDTMQWLHTHYYICAKCHKAKRRQLDAIRREKEGRD